MDSVYADNEDYDELNSHRQRRGDKVSQIYGGGAGDVYEATSHSKGGLTTTTDQNDYSYGAPYSSDSTYDQTGGIKSHSNSDDAYGAPYSDATYDQTGGIKRTNPNDYTYGAPYSDDGTYDQTSSMQVENNAANNNSKYGVTSDVYATANRNV